MRNHSEDLLNCVNVKRGAMIGVLRGVHFVARENETRGIRYFDLVSYQYCPVPPKR